MTWGNYRRRFGGFNPEIDEMNEQDQLRNKSNQERALMLLQSSSCFNGDVCWHLPCACAETIAKFAGEIASEARQGADPGRKELK